MALARRVFSCWTGTNRMSAQRLAAFKSMRNLGVDHVHVTRATLGRWIAPTQPLHPAFEYLSAVHQSDYLRCYLLHVHGGGYSDIKPTYRSWRPHFAALDRSTCLGAGYTEIGPHGVAPVGGALERRLKANVLSLIGCCAFVFHPRSQFTTSWFAGVTAVLDTKVRALRRNPARYPYDRRGVIYSDGSRSRYPLAWTELLGNIFHPLVYAHRAHLLHLDMAPRFEDYK